MTWRSDAAFSSTRIVSDVGTGLWYGVGMAVILTVISAVSLVLSRTNPFETMHMTWLRGVSCNFIAGTLAGTAAGMMRPIGKWVLGSVAIGAVAGGITGAVFAIGEFGRGNSNAHSIGFAVLLSVFGAIMGPVLRTKIRGGRALG